MKIKVVLLSLVWLFIVSVPEPQAQQRKRRTPRSEPVRKVEQRKDNTPKTKPQEFTFDGTRFTVARADAKDWAARYPYAFSNVKESLVSLTLKFEDNDMIGISYAIDYRDPNKSDIALACGTQRINPIKLATLADPSDIERRGQIVVETPGGFLQKDGRMGSILMQRREMSLTFFFDVPPSCANQKLILHLLFDDKHAFTADAGSIVP